nr:glycosyltransferase family 2 protein [Rhodomicrobium sp. Az07]
MGERLGRKYRSSPSELHRRIPDFLEHHRRLGVRHFAIVDNRSSDGTREFLTREPEIRLFDGAEEFDDDLIFPPDFVDVMTSKVAAHCKRAIFATHGVLLRQPIVRYYEPTSRAITLHFGHALETDRGVHMGATNAPCFHSSAIEMAWDDFKYCNSGDVWLSLYAQAQSLPVLTPARPRNWVRENTHAVPGETIYHHSLKRTRTRFDSSSVQDAVLRHAWPITLKTAKRAKLAVAIAVDKAQDTATAVSHWLRRAEQIADTAELVMMLAYDAGDAALAETVAELRIPHETHLIDTSKLDGNLSRYPVFCACEYDRTAKEHDLSIRGVAKACGKTGAARTPSRDRRSSRMGKRERDRCP